MINTAKDAEVSICPTIIIPVIDNYGRYFRVRTLLDSGSGTNWITKDVLNKIKHTIIKRKTLEVSTFSGEVRQKFTLAEVYIHDDRGKLITITCYVMDKYTAHVPVEGIVPHIRYNHTTPYNFSKELADPNSLEVDHTDAAEQVGIILCSATINRLRTPEPITHLPELKILLEPTIFGTAISGAIPKILKSSQQHATAHNIAITSICDPSDPQQNLCQDVVTGQPLVNTPFNDKMSMLKNNISRAATTPLNNHSCKHEKWDMGPKKQFPSDSNHRFFNRSAPTTFISIKQVLFYCMIIVLYLASTPYIFKFTQSIINTQYSPQVSLYLDKMHFPTAETNLHLPYKRGESMSLFQFKMSRIVLKHFRRKIIHHYSSTCIQVNNKCLTTKVPSNHIFLLSSNNDTFSYFIIQKFSLLVFPSSSFKKNNKVQFFF